jgi:hypothetical protein
VEVGAVGSPVGRGEVSVAVRGEILVDFGEGLKVGEKLAGRDTKAGIAQAITKIVNTSNARIVHFSVRALAVDFKP